LKEKRTNTKKLGEGIMRSKSSKKKEKEKE